MADRFAAFVRQEVGRVARQCLLRVGCCLCSEQAGVGIGDITSGYLIVHDPQLLEDGLHQHLLDAVGSSQVEASGVDQEAQTLVQTLREVLGRGQVPLNYQLGRSQFGRDLPLLLFELGDVHGVCEVGILGLLPTPIQLDDAALL